MAKGISLHIGVNRVDPAQYALAPLHHGWECVFLSHDGGTRVRVDGDFVIGWEGPLASCERDAEDMCRIAAKQGFEATVLKTEKATAKRVSRKLKAAAKRLERGDIFLLTYAGHGSQVEDLSGDEKDDYLDETWCLYDRMLLDDEQRALYARFAEGVRIVVVADCCHSGTATRGGVADLTSSERRRLGIRGLTERTALAIYEGSKERYDRIQKRVEKKPSAAKAERILLSACQDWELALGDDENGKFTRAIKAVFAAGDFQSYPEFYTRILEHLESEYVADVEAAKRGGQDAASVMRQTPNLVPDPKDGEILPWRLSAFLKERPFSIQTQSSSY